LIAQEQDVIARRVWQDEMRQVDPHSLIFLDETSTPTTLTPLRGRAPRGTRVVGRVPRGRWTNVTLVATLTPTGFGPGLHLDGAIDRDSFDTFVIAVLVPTLRPGQTIIMDNLSVHKSATARAAIEAAGCTLTFLPTYSPDLNPIEQAFSKLKQRLRHQAARTPERIKAATQALYPTITAQDARGFYRDAGYFL